MSVYEYPARDLSDVGVRVRFHRNEAAVAAPRHVVEAVRALGGDALRRYPVEMQRCFVESLARSFGVGAERIAIANGADELLNAVARASLEPGDEAIFAAPSFAMYGRSVALARGTPVAVPYRKRWSLDADEVIARITARTRLIVLGNPNNPTGDSLPAAQAVRIASAAPHGTLVIDEVYLAFSERSLFDAVRSLPNVAIVRSLSKSAGLAGMRVGFCVAPEPFAALLRAQITPYPLSVASLAAATAYLENAQATRAYEIALAAQQSRSLDAIENAILPFADVWRGAGNFLLADFGSRSAALLRALSERGIAARSFDDPQLIGFVRFCAGSDEDTDELLDTIRSCMRETVDA